LTAARAPMMRGDGGSQKALWMFENSKFQQWPPPPPAASSKLSPLKQFCSLPRPLSLDPAPTHSWYRAIVP